MSGRIGWSNYSDISEGWHPIMDAFCHLVENDIINNGMPMVEQITAYEKLASLRIHFRGGDRRTSDYASFATGVSKRVCESCGRPAAGVSENGFWRALCTEHN